MKSEIAKARKLDRGMIAFVTKTRDNLKVSFREALEQMKIQADVVAKDMGVSEAFVLAWVTKELSTRA